MHNDGGGTPPSLPPLFIYPTLRNVFVSICKSMDLFGSSPPPPPRDHAEEAGQALSLEGKERKKIRVRPSRFSAAVIFFFYYFFQYDRICK